MSNKIIVYSDTEDFIFSFMPFGSFIISMFIAGLFESSLMQGVVFLIGTIVTIVSAYVAVTTSILHARPTKLGVIVGIVQILSAGIGAFVLIGSLKTVFSEESSTKESLKAMLIFGIFIWPGERLINGEAFYATKGWDFPEEALEEVKE